MKEPNLDEARAKAVRARWPSGAPADPAQALAALKLRKVFRGNVSNDPRWVTDGHMAFAADGPGDAALRARLAAERTGHAGYDGAQVERVVAPYHGGGSWPVEPAALFLDHADRAVKAVVRYRVVGGPPVLDVNADVVRTAHACVGGWDSATWEGFGDEEFCLRLWRAGSAVAVVAGFTFSDKPRCPPIPEADLVSGRHARPPGFLCPEGELAEAGDAPADGPEGVARAAAGLGGGPLAWGAFSWEAPTRAGRVRLGWVDGRALVFAEDLLRMRCAPQSWKRPDGAGLLTFGSVRLLLDWLRDARLAAPPKHRHLVPPPAKDPGPAPYAAPFSVAWGPGWTRIFDAARGAFLPGEFDGEERGRALAQRLVTARCLTRLVAPGAHP